MFLIIYSFLFCFSPVEIENAGLLPEAGAAWAAEENIPGQIRIIGRLLEEALYAGDTQRAYLLAFELDGVSDSQVLHKFWMARIAWASGLSEVAINELDNLSPDDPWLYYRTKGLVFLYKQDGQNAIEQLTHSLRAATSARKAFWSAIDLCTAYLSVSEYEKALELSQHIYYYFPNDALAKVMYGLCLQASGHYSNAAVLLTSIEETNVSAFKIAQGILEGFEQ